MEILQLVDQFESLLRSSTRLPGTSRLLINEDECYRFIDQMRITVPDVVKQSQRTLQERDRILAQAKEEAERMLARTREKAQELVKDQDIVHAAEKQAEQIRQEAEQAAAKIRAEAEHLGQKLQHDAQQVRERMHQEADEYAIATLESLGQQLDRVRVEVRNGIEALRPRRTKTDPSNEN